MNKFSTWVIIGLMIYVLVMVIVLAFVVWKYNPIWMSLLLGLYALVSFVAGIALAYIANKFIAKK